MLAASILQAVRRYGGRAGGWTDGIPRTNPSYPALPRLDSRAESLNAGLQRGGARWGAVGEMGASRGGHCTPPRSPRTSPSPRVA